MPLGRRRCYFWVGGRRPQQPTPLASSLMRIEVPGWWSARGPPSGPTTHKAAMGLASRISRCSTDFWTPTSKRRGRPWCRKPRSVVREYTLYYVGPTEHHRRPVTRVYSADHCKHTQQQTPTVSHRLPLSPAFDNAFKCTPLPPYPGATGLGLPARLVISCRLQTPPSHARALDLGANGPCRAVGGASELAAAAVIDVSHRLRRRCRGCGALGPHLHSRRVAVRRPESGRCARAMLRPAPARTWRGVAGSARGPHVPQHRPQRHSRQPPQWQLSEQRQ